MKTKNLLILFALGLGLALVWVLGGVSTPSAAAPRVEGHTEAPGAPAAELHVCPSGCTYSSIQDAVDAANDGDVIKVTTGTYTGVSARPAPTGYEEAPASGLITQVVYVSKTITIQGGYTPGFTDPPDPEANPTTLDAQGQGRVLYIGGSISPTIEGLHITGGDATGLGGAQWSGRDGGGGVYIHKANVSLGSSMIHNNTASTSNDGKGGGMYLYDSNSTIYDNTISSNVASIDGFGVGGGIYADHGAPALRSNHVLDNFASVTGAGNGGGLALDDVFGTHASIEGNTVQRNVASADAYGYGGGIYLWQVGRSSQPAPMTRNLVLGNTASLSGTAPGYGAGLAIRTSDLYLANNIIAGNDANTTGDGIIVTGYTGNATQATLKHNTLASNGNQAISVRGSYSPYPPPGSTDLVVDLTLANNVISDHSVGVDIGIDGEVTITVDIDTTLWWNVITRTRTGGITGTILLTQTSDITGDPAFVDSRDYHIGLGSAAIDAGVDTGVYDDIDGDDRPLDGDGDGTDEFDIGADEFLPNPDLVITKQASLNAVQPGGQVTYTISVANTGNVDLHATITDTLPLSVTLGGTLIPPGGTLTPPGGTVVLPDGRVAVIWTAVITAPGGTWMGTIHVTVDADAAGPLTNLVEVTTKEGVTGQARAIVNAHKVYLPLVMRGFL